jgi:hypothetical protein
VSPRFPRLPFQAVDARREAHHTALHGVLRAPCSAGATARLTAWAHRYGVASLRDVLATCEGIDASWRHCGMLPPAEPSSPPAPEIAPSETAHPEVTHPEVTHPEPATPRSEPVSQPAPEPSPPIGRPPMPTHPSLEQLRSWLPDEPLAS